MHMQDSVSTPYIVIARRYRPQRFDQVLGQDAVVTTLRHAIQQNRVAQAYLFCGTRGTGKTSLARILAKALNCKERSKSPDPCGTCASCREIASSLSLDVLEIDGASHRGIDDIRALTESIPYTAAHGGYKVTILDEVHMLTKEAFNALLKTLEEPPPNTIFIFATTEPHKVPATILSRCQRFDLARIPIALLMQKLERIVSESSSQISPEALFLVAERAEGSFRDSESLLEQVLSFASGSAIDADLTAAALGLTPRRLWLELDRITAEGDLSRAVTLSKEIVGSGINIVEALEHLLEHLRCHLLLQLGQIPEGMPLEWLNSYRECSSSYSKEQLFLVIEELVEAWQQARSSTPSIWWFEYLILRMARSRHRLSIESAVGKLLSLEQRLAGSVSPASSSAPAPIPSTARITPPAPPTSSLSPVVEPNPVSVPPKKEAPSVNTAAPKETLRPAPSSTETLPPGRLDTLLRFTAVELEGTLSSPPRS